MKTTGQPYHEHMKKSWQNHEVCLTKQMQSMGSIAESRFSAKKGSFVPGHMKKVDNGCEYDTVRTLFAHIIRNAVLMPAEHHEETTNTKHRPLSARNCHATLNDVIVVETYEPGFLLAVEEARATRQPIEIKLIGYGKEDIATACLWYALDQGVKVSVTNTAIDVRAALVDDSDCDSGFAIPETAFE